MKKGRKLYEGKAKILYSSPEKGTAIQHFKDNATAFNNQKQSTIEGKGILNNRISEHIFSSLNQIGIENHLIKRINMREQLIKLVEIIPIEFVVRNIATGSLTKRLGIPDGTVLSKPLLEYSYKNDELGDPLVAREHILEFNWIKHAYVLDFINDSCLRINDFMQGMFRGVGIKLVDFKLEFGIETIDGKDWKEADNNMIDYGLILGSRYTINKKLYLFGTYYWGLAQLNNDDEVRHRGLQINLSYAFNGPKIYL